MTIHIYVYVKQNVTTLQHKDGVGQIRIDLLTSQDAVLASDHNLLIKIGKSINDAVLKHVPHKTICSHNSLHKIWKMCSWS